ncbi:hypothetical protein GOP47_0013260 [Adiantum capillus-veneris]|uniref:F-ATPase gamma subunit n=1 Tax=Adiantum capillus-veneris TaxID=13818 RepID=A0A9D4UNR7_ADICA|nr:hypothetical protein GOP47_0013260 [Adiantum capillus-veneris]
MASSSARNGVSRLSHLLSKAAPVAAPSLQSPSWQCPGLAPGELAPFGTRMASSQIVRNRMKSVKSIQKITKAMKMVAASKLRGVQTKTENSRGFWQPFVALMGDHPDIDTKKNIVLTISSDRGLCGGINSTVVKLSKGIFKLLESEEPTKYIVIGEKGKMSMIADEILKNVEFEAIRMVYNKFASVVSFIPAVATIMAPELIAKESEAGGKLAQLESYEIEGGDSKAEVLQNLSEFQFAAMLFSASLENACSEQGARMSAMDSSTRNASEMLEKLTQKYNRSRQASITTELIEIISGAAALEAAS